MKLYLKQTTILMGMCSALGMYAPEVQASNGEANSLIATSVQQTKKVTGNISDSMGPLIGATIKEKGTSNGVVTDLEGNFSINVKPGATLVISYVGYNTKEVVVGNQTNIKISMEEEGHANSTSKCKITKCFCKSTPLVLRNSISFLVSH